MDALLSSVSSAAPLLAGVAPWFGLYAGVFGVSWFAAPALLEHVRKMSSAEKSYWCSSMCSTVNSFVVTPLAYAACASLHLWAPSASFTVRSALSTMSCHALLGYTAFDMLPLLYYRDEWALSLIHI